MTTSAIFVLVPRLLIGTAYQGGDFLGNCGGGRLTISEQASTFNNEPILMLCLYSQNLDDCFILLYSQTRDWI